MMRRRLACLLALLACNAAPLRRQTLRQRRLAVRGGAAVEAPRGGIAAPTTARPAAPTASPAAAAAPPAGVMSKLPVTVEKWDVVKFIWSYLWGRSLGQDALVITSATCLIAAKLLNVCVPFCLQRFVDAMAEGGSTAKAFTYLSYYCGTFLLVRLLGELRAMSFLRVSQRAAREFSDDVFAELLSKRADFHGAHPSGALAVAFGRAARGFSSLAFLFVFSVVPTILELGLSTSVLARRFQSPALGAVVVATFTLYAGFTAVFVELRIKSRKELAALEVEKGAALVDGLVNHEAVKLANAAASQVASFDRILERAEKASVWSQGLGSMLNAGQATIFGAGLCVALRLVASKAARGTEFSLGDIIATNALLMQLAQPMNFLGYTVSEIRQGLVDCNAMLGLVVHPGSKRLRRRGGPAAHVPPLDMTYGAIPPPRVEFDDVWLDRSAAEDGTGGAAPSTWSLRGATFSAPAGGVTLLCGASGSGKTSALRLCALLDGPPTRGTLKLWGADIRDIGDEAVRSRLAFVSQSTDLFDGTVAFNIAYGTGRDVVAVEAAATDACLDVDLAAGVGERGTKLSGGERQRVLIARALARNGRPLARDPRLFTVASRPIRGPAAARGSRALARRGRAKQALAASETLYNRFPRSSSRTSPPRPPIPKRKRASSPPSCAIRTRSGRRSSSSRTGSPPSRRTQAAHLTVGRPVARRKPPGNESREAAEAL